MMADGPAQLRPHRSAAAPLCLLALAALFLAPYLFGGRAMLPLELIPVFQPWARHRELWGAAPPVQNPLLDALQQYYPRRVYMTRALHEGWLPLWNPYVYGGTPFLGSQQGAVLYPPAWLLALLAPELQFGWSAFFHLTLAGAGTFLFLRHLGLRRAAALAGAVAFAFNGFVVAWLAYPNVTQWTLCWLPLALYLWERGRASDDLRWALACGVALCLNLLGGHGQSSAYVFLAWGAWALFRCLGGPRPARAALRWIALPAALAVALALGHLLPVLDYVPRTDRGARVPWESVRAAGMPLAQLWTFLLPRLFGDETLSFGYQPTWLPLGDRARLAFVERTFYPGCAVLVLAAAAWAGGRAGEQRRLAGFSAALSLAAVLLAMVTPLYWPLWRFAPGFSQFTAVARVLCLAAWGLACLAALGVQALTDPEATVRRRAWIATGAAGLLGALVAGLGYFIYGGAAPAAVGQILARSGAPSPESLAMREIILALVWLLAPALLAGLSARGVLKPGLAGGLAVAVVAADLFAFGFSFNPAADPALLHRTTGELTFLQSRGEPFRLLSAGPPGQEMDLPKRMPSNLPATYGFPDIGGSDSFVPLRYRAWEDALTRAGGGKSPWARPGAGLLRSAGVRYYLTGSRDLFAGLRPVVGTGLQEDPGALPYARLHLNAQALPSTAELLRTLALPNRALPVALTAGPGAPTFDGPPQVVPFAARRVNGNRLLLEGTAPGPGLLVVAEQFDPGWRARVDGKVAPIAPAEGLLVGIPVGAGAHRVELAYAPDTYRAGAFGSLAALACLCGLLIGIRRRSLPPSAGR